MRIEQGHWQGVALKSRFYKVAGEYVVAPNRHAWVHVPHIVTIRDPSDEKPLRAARSEMQLSALFKEPAQRAEWRDEMRYHYKNLLIELRERIPEVLDALYARQDAVITDTIQRLGLNDYQYHIGVQLLPGMISSLKTDPELRHCSFRPVHIGDIAETIRLRMAA